MKKKVLAVIAHPDDETIWVGGTLLRNKENWDTTIICLCRKHDKDRAPKFKKACKGFNAKCFISDLEDENKKSVSMSEYVKRILKYAGKKYDYIFTHGENGEYGHIRHKEVHKAVKEMIRKKKILCKSLFFFSYLKRKNNYQGYCIHNSSANMFIKLNNFELNKKKNIITNVYGYLKGGFEEKSCRKIESFNEK